MANAGDRPPHYDKKTVLEPSRGTGPRATGTSRPGGLSYRRAGGCHRGEKNAAPSRRARACPSPCILVSNLITPVSQDRLILTRSGAGAPELQRWAQCLPVFACPPRRDNYRNGVMKHPQVYTNSRRNVNKKNATIRLRRNERSH